MSSNFLCLILHSCGACSASATMTCDGTTFQGLATDACYAPECYYDTSFERLTGASCRFATIAVQGKYPGMNVYYQSDTVAMPLEDDLNRYIIVTDASKDKVSSIVFNRNAECPTTEAFKEDASCSVVGQRCEFTQRTDEPFISCTITEFATCQFGIFSVGPDPLRLCNFGSPF